MFQAYRQFVKERAGSHASNENSVDALVADIADSIARYGHGSTGDDR